MTIKVGDVVRAERNGDQKMTVDSLGEWCGKPACVCKWFVREGDGWGELQEGEFHLGELRVVEPETSPVGGDGK